MMAVHRQKHSQSVTLIVGLAFAVNVIATAVAAGSERPPPETACVAYDLHIFTLVEDHGLVEDTAAEVLSDAAFRLFEARLACRDGDTKRALDIYDSIHLESVRMSALYRVLLR
jgi:hypothetical protein